MQGFFLKKNEVKEKGGWKGKKEYLDEMRAKMELLCCMGGEQAERFI